MRKPVYHLLKDSELRKLLKECGLETKGDKSELVRRHQRFAALWNTQCELELGSAATLSKMEVLMRCKKEEQAERREREAASGARSHLLEYDR